MTKEEQKEYWHWWYLNHKDLRAIYNHFWRLNHKEHIEIYNRNYYLEHLKKKKSKNLFIVALDRIKKLFIIR